MYYRHTVATQCSSHLPLSRFTFMFYQVPSSRFSLLFGIIGQRRWLCLAVSALTTCGTNCLFSTSGSHRCSGSFVATPEATSVLDGVRQPPESSVLAPWISAAEVRKSRAFSLSGERHRSMRWESMPYVSALVDCAPVDFASSFIGVDAATSARKGTRQPLPESVVLAPWISEAEVRTSRAFSLSGERHRLTRWEFIPCVSVSVVEGDPPRGWCRAGRSK